MRYLDVGARSCLAATLALCASAAVPQNPNVEVKTAAQIVVLESSLREQATAGGGLATAFIEQYPQYYTQMIVRTKSGEVEIHQNYDEMVIVRDGSGSLNTGGTPRRLRTVKPGELRSSAAPGSKPLSLAEGIFVFIPAGTPHQVIVPIGGSIVYIDIKVARR